LGSARESFERALELNPNLAEAHAQYAWYLNLLGQQDSAVAEMQRAHALDPLEPTWKTWLGDLAGAVGHWEDMVENLRAALDQFPDHPWALFQLGLGLAKTGRFDDAIAAETKAVTANVFWPLGSGIPQSISELYHPPSLILAIFLIYPKGYIEP
jgi:tetratricopeptide (TPR) repeat protein